MNVANSNNTNSKSAFINTHGRLDMAIFRAGVDALDVGKKPAIHVFCGTTSPALTGAVSIGCSSSKATAPPPPSLTGLYPASPPSTSPSSSPTGDDACAHTAAVSSSSASASASFGELAANATSTWDLLHSVPDGVAKVASGDLLYRFCARRVRDLSLEDRAEVASLVNMSGFGDELKENDQPILDFLLNKHHGGGGVDDEDGEDGGEKGGKEKQKKKKQNKQQQQITDVSDLLVVVVRLVGLLPFVTSRDVNVDCVTSKAYQRAMAAPDETLESIDRFRTYRKIKNVIPFVFTFKFQMTGSEVADEETLAEHAHHHNAIPTRIVLMERTRKTADAAADGTIKSKAWNIYYDIPPRGISAITGGPLSPEAAAWQEEQYRRQSPAERARAATRDALLLRIHNHSLNKDNVDSGGAGERHQEVDQQQQQRQKRGEKGPSAGMLVDHTVIIVRGSIPAAVAGMVEMVGNKVAHQTCDQILKTRQFLYRQKLRGLEGVEGAESSCASPLSPRRAAGGKKKQGGGGFGEKGGGKAPAAATDEDGHPCAGPWRPMVGGGDHPNALFAWERAAAPHQLQKQ